MADLTQELPVEKLNEESWIADKNERRAKVASRNPATANEKSIYRQMAWSNVFTDHLGDVIRHVNSLSSDDKADTAGERFFNEIQKKAIVEKLRAAILANNKNAGYLMLAKDYGYEAADDFEGNNSGATTMDESTASLVDKFAKKYANKVEKTRRSPYKRPRSFNQSSAPSYQVAPQPYYDQPMYQQQQSFHQAPMPHQVTPMSPIPTFPPQHRGFAFPGRAKPHGVDKRFSVCKNCKGLGHWGGDPECPWSRQGFASIGQPVMPEPKPPGSE